MSNRLQNVNMIILTGVIMFAVYAQSIVSKINQLNPTIGSLAVVLASFGFYRFLIVAMYWAINHSSFLLMYYWNRLYLNGYWSYTYTLEGSRHYGVWRIDQDLFGTTVDGFGVRNDLVQRSHVNSVTQLIANEGKYDVVNSRVDEVHPDRVNYSKTTLSVETKRRSWYTPQIPFKMLAITVIYGGNLSGVVHPDVVFERHWSATCEDDVVADLARTYSLPEPISD